MKLIAAIGAGEYKPTTYMLADKCATAICCALALVECVRPGAVFLAMTEQPSVKHGEPLVGALPRQAVGLRHARWGAEGPGCGRSGFRWRR